MSLETRRSALRAAARVAFGSLSLGTVLGCGGAVSATGDQQGDAAFAGSTSNGSTTAGYTSAGSASSGSTIGGYTAGGSTGVNGTGGYSATLPDGAGAVQIDAAPTVLDAAPTAPTVLDATPALDAISSDSGLACAAAITLPASLIGGAPAPAVTRAAFDCCQTYITARISNPDGSVAPPTQPALTALGADPSATNCCKVLIAAVDAANGDGGRVATYTDVALPVTQVCCYGRIMPNVPSSLCTPWGPPVPPAIDFAVESLATEDFA